MTEFIGNISTIEFLICTEYLIAVLLSIGILIRSDSLFSQNNKLPHRLFFLSITFIIIILLITQLTNLNTKVAESVRHVAKYQGWYKNRYDFQILIVGIISVAGIISLILIDRFRLRVFRDYRLTLFGLIFLTGYIMISSISYHPIDQLLFKEFAGLKLGRFFELLGTTWITVSLFIDFMGFSQKKIIVKKRHGARYI